MKVVLRDARRRDGMSEKRYWPFPVLPEERRAERHRQEIAFLEEAVRRGFRAYAFGIEGVGENFGVEAGNGRCAEMIFRGRMPRWEVLLVEGEKLAGKRMIDGTEAAAEIMFRWLEGETAERAVGVEQ